MVNFPFIHFRQNILRIEYLKKSNFFTLSCIFLDLLVVRPSFFRGRVELCWEKLSDTLNIFIQHL
eukprot:UN15283